MVESAEDRGDATAPFPAVVDRAHCEEKHRCEGEGADREPRRARGCQNSDDDPVREREWRDSRVEPAPKFGLEGGDDVGGSVLGRRGGVGCGFFCGTKKLFRAAPSLGVALRVGRSHIQSRRSGKNGVKNSVTYGTVSY